MLFLRFFMILCAIAGVVCSTPSHAQDKVAVRTSANQGYERLVFQWQAKPEYSISKEGGRILVRFSKAGALDMAGVAANANIKKIEALSKDGEALQVAVSIPDGSKFRDFTVQNKMIIDVYDPDGAVKKTEEKPVAPVAEKPVAAAPKEEPVKEAAKGDFTVKPAPSEEAAPVHPVEAAKVAAPAIEPHAITLTSTTSTGMAAFVRNGWLWIVIDAMDLPNAPKVEGPQADKLPALEKIEIETGVAYRMDLPEGMNVYGEGGGLSWKILLMQTPKPKQIEPVKPLEQADGTPAKLVWPLKDMRTILTFTDPAVGDTITAVTAIHAAQYTGPARNYVNLRTLNSAIGLAFVAKSDDVTAEKTIAEVSVGRPGGLALSSAKDVASEQIRQAMAEEKKPVEEKPAAEKAGEEKPDEEKPDEQVKDMALTEEPPAQTEVEHVTPEPVVAASKDELSKATEEKPTGNNIYNFARWEMGGIPALEKNLHVMMVEISNKKEDARNEDIITMAKLNLANNRGSEALGLLRIAVLKVPELEDNAEFQALRAAALALSKKYDEAIIDYTREDLKKYDDIKYWTAYTLAGLEDWKQAITVLPKNFEAIAQYPRELRTPMALVFTEIALRGADVPRAARIMKILEPEKGHLPLAYNSAWNYLQGEAERQAGHADKAIAIWEPLVKNGKDDLYRAKAGLSLTKLQLDQKKITPEQAIDRLEGLRYAWRGDELETLINFRLGQIYVENKDYLKGLTVLRNAETLAPREDIAKEVADYMTRTFREVFNNDRLKAITPLEAISLHEEFKDLLPIGEEGDRFTEKLAERLVDADLLGRAATLLEYQVNNRLKGDKKAEIAIRLAAIRLLDGNPEGALRSLEIAQDTLDKLSGKKPAVADIKPEDLKPEAGEAAVPAPKAEEAKIEAAKPVEEAKPAEEVKPALETADPEKQRQIYLLKARALSMKKQVDEAMKILEAMPLDSDVNRLRTDIAWTAGRWEEAAMALNDLIVAEDISPKRPLTDYQRDIILNRAIALNLSGNRVALANARERFNAQMKDTAKGQMFEVVTRPRKPDMIGSREAIDSMISEIDLFKGFLDSYTKTEGAKDDVKEPVAVKEPVPAEGTKSADAKAPEAEKSVTKLPEEEKASETAGQKPAH